MSSIRVTLAAIGVLLFFACPTAVAHTFTITKVVALLKQDGTFIVDMQVDVDALALGVSGSVPSEQLAETLSTMSPDGLEKAIEHAERTLMRRVRIRFDDQRVPVSISFPRRGSGYVNAPTTEPTILGTLARFEGRAPEEATTFTFGASRAFNVVQLTILDEATARGAKHVLTPGADSPPYHLGEIQVDDRGAVLSRYLVLGFEHILPKGVDHILFVLGLFLLSTRVRPLLWQVSAFTVAHSITLALSMADVASLPSRVVEPLIALSIAYVAIENLFVQELKPWRPAVVFLFGLLHGMGFAGVLRDLGMPAGRFGLALVGFNLGVEGGQLAVITAAFLTLGLFRHKRWYRSVIVRPASLAIALVGLYWAVTRTISA